MTMIYHDALATRAAYSTLPYVCFCPSYIHYSPLVSRSTVLSLAIRRVWHCRPGCSHRPIWLLKKERSFVQLRDEPRNSQKHLLGDGHKIHKTRLWGCDLFVLSSFVVFLAIYSPLQSRCPLELALAVFLQVAIDMVDCGYVVNLGCCICRCFRFCLSRFHSASHCSFLPDKVPCYALLWLVANLC